MAAETSVDPSSFRPFEVTAVHLVYVGLGFFIVIFGMFSLFIKERLYLGEAPLAAVFGIIVGPACLNLFDPSGWAGNKTGAPGGEITDEITLEVLRVTIALSVFAVGVELPKKYLLRHWRSIAFLLGPVMVWGWLVTAGFMCALVPGLDFLNSLVVASCVTPTDPILAQAVVGGPWAEKHVPAHLRHILMCESGCNDGAAFPFLYLALFLTLHRDNHGKAIAEWFYDAWAYQIIFGTLLGALIGWAARKAMRFSERHKLVDRESFVAQYVSLAIASMGVNVLLGSDDLLAAFACGTAFAWDGWFTKQTEDSNFSSIIDLLFNVAVFVYLGALMPFRDWAGGPADEPNTLSIWRLFVLAICVLLTKRLPIVIALWRWIPDIKTFREAVFAGHFGPIGVGAIFIATLARTELPEHVNSPPQNSNDVLALTVQPIIFFFVICSIALHGLTIPFFAFSKGASKMTRTWSRNPSFFDAEPGWVSRMRKRTGESLQPEEGNMTEIERVLNAQLRQIGKGAIGGDAERDRESADTPPASGGSGTSSGEEENRQLRGRCDYNGDDFEPNEHDDAMGGDDWGGEETIEMRRFRDKERAQKEAEYASLRQRQQGYDEEARRSQDSRQQDKEDGDLGSARMMDEERGAMDRDLPHTEEEEAAEKHQREGIAKYGCSDPNAPVSSSSSTSSDKQAKEHAMLRDKCEEHYPKSRSWIEGHNLVIEYQKSRLSEVECHTMPMQDDDERDQIAEAEQPAHAWAMKHAGALEHYAGFENVQKWSPREAVHNLVQHSVPKKYTEMLSRRHKRRNSDVETKEDSDARFQALYGGISYASQHRQDEDTNDHRRTYEDEVPYRQIMHNDASQGQISTHSTRSSRTRQRKPPKEPRERTPSPPVVGWLKPREADIQREQMLQAKAARRRRARGDGSASSPQRSTSPTNSASPTRQAFALAGGKGGAKEHKCASDARRRSTLKKVLAGRVSMCPDASGHESGYEEVVDAPSTMSFSGLGLPRSASTGGLGQTLATSSSSDGRRSMLHDHSSSSGGSGSHSSGLLTVPRTQTASSSNSANTRARLTMDRLMPHGAGHAQHSRSSSVQWLDIPDEAHSQRSGISGRFGKIDLARLGGGISRPSSRAGSPTRQGNSRGQAATTMSTSAAEELQHDVQSGWSETGNRAVSLANDRSSRKPRNRLANLFGSTTHEGTRQSQTYPASTPASIRNGVPGSSNPTVIVGAGEYPGGDNSGILNNEMPTSPAQGDESGVASPSERGVTFNL